MSDFINDGRSIPTAPQPKDPNSVLIYGCDWGAFGWLDEGETITTSSWIVPTGLYSSSESFTDSKTSILLGGGVSGEEYTLTNRIETSAGQIEDRSMIIKCGEK